MRAAHILATALVVANARPKWRADRAMLPALATLPRYPTNHTQTHTPQQHTHALASQIAEWPAGCPTQHATHARKAHHHAATTSLSTLQHSAAKIPRVFRPCAAPARQPMLCCAAPHHCKPQLASPCISYRLSIQRVKELLHFLPFPKASSTPEFHWSMRLGEVDIFAFWVTTWPK